MRGYAWTYMGPSPRYGPRISWVVDFRVSEKISAAKMNELLLAMVQQTALDYRALYRVGVMRSGFPTAQLHKVGRGMRVEKISRQEVMDLCRFLHSITFAVILEKVGAECTPDEFVQRIERATTAEAEWVSRS